MSEDGNANSNHAISIPIPGVFQVYQDMEANFFRGKKLINAQIAGIRAALCTAIESTMECLLQSDNVVWIQPEPKKALNLRWSFNVSDCRPTDVYPQQRSQRYLSFQLGRQRTDDEWKLQNDQLLEIVLALSLCTDEIRSSLATSTDESRSGLEQGFKRIVGCGDLGSASRLESWLHQRVTVVPLRKHQRRTMTWQELAAVTQLISCIGRDWWKIFSWGNLESLWVMIASEMRKTDQSRLKAMAESDVYFGMFLSSYSA